MDNWHEDRCTFMIISHSILLRVKNISDKGPREKTHGLIWIFFPPKNRAIYEITWKNIVERGKPQMAIWRMRIGLKSTDTHSEYVIDISFPLQ